LKKIILAKLSGFDESNKVLIACYCCFIESTDLPIPGIILHAS